MRLPKLRGGFASRRHRFRFCRASPLIGVAHQNIEQEMDLPSAACGRGRLVTTQMLGLLSPAACHVRLSLEDLDTESIALGQVDQATSPSTVFQRMCRQWRSATGKLPTSMAEIAEPDAHVWKLFVSVSRRSRL